jgi:prevent-host-death family protein
MTLGGELQASGMREVRERIRAVVARVEQGDPLVILQHGQPVAVMLRFDEARRWERIERTLAAFHGLEVYPELAAATTELAGLLRGDTSPSRVAIAELTAEEREILAPLRTATITETREKFATYLEEIGRGRPLTIISSGRFVVTAISPAEFDRLRALGRTVAWFRAAGLDLETADEAAVAAFVRDFRSRPAASDEAAVG